MYSIIETEFITLPLFKSFQNKVFNRYSYIFIQKNNKNFCIKASILLIVNLYIVLKLKNKTEQSIIGVWKVKKLK